MPEESGSPKPTRRLPQHPSLEQLKKQARELLERFRAGDAAAIAEVDRFERKTDGTTFALHDAQRVLARVYGFQSWTKLKAFVDGVTVARLAVAVNAGDLAQVRRMLAARPELIGMDISESDEHRVLHYAVMRRDVPMVRFLMQSGADARKGIWPHRDATSALTIARDREFDDVVVAIEEEELKRQKELSCPNATISPAQDEIAAAIRRGETETAIRLLQENPSLLEACDRHGGTLLHIAAQQCNAELVAWLLERGATVRKRDVRGLTALDRAALAVEPRNDRGVRFPAVARLLLEHGADLTVRGAVTLGDVSRVEALMAASPEVLREIDQSGGIVSLAVKHGQFEVARLLLDLGADVDERTLLDELEEPTETAGMPLWWAALAGDLAITRLLLDRGADPNANVYASGWPLRNAWKHDSVKQLLLERGAKMQPYMLAELHDVEEAKRLLASSPSEDVVHELLWEAAESGCAEIVELALPQMKWPKDDKRWHWVMIQPIRGAGRDSDQNEGRFRCMAALLRHGVDPNVTRFGATPLHFAAARLGSVGDSDRARFAAMLVEHGARTDLRDDTLKSTPLGWACRWGRLKMAEVLIQRGASIDEPDAEPWATPKAWARKMGHEKVLELPEGHQT